MKIVMLRDEIVMHAKGPERLFAGQEYEIEEAVAASVIGRGYAKAVEVPAVKVAEVAEVADEPVKEKKIRHARQKANAAPLEESADGESS